MNAADLAAYIGAAAWVPQIGTWVYDAYSKPKLKIVSGPSIEVGYTAFGPVANATLAISSERRDALIERMRLQVTHEHGEQRFLRWNLLNETQQQIRDPQGNISSQYKNTPAIALKVSTLSLTERTVGFRDSNYEELDRATTSTLTAQFRYDEAQAGNAAALDTLLRSRGFKNAQRTFEDNMYWRAGKWEFLFSAQLAGVKKPHTQKFTVEFSDDDITTLRRNFDLLEPYVRATRSTPEEKAPNWNWTYPPITPSSES